MRIPPRSTRRATAVQALVDKENRSDDYGQSPPRNSITVTPNRKSRHRLSITELARLEGVFGKETHPSRQRKKDLADELGMDYKTVTIWFQNKRQTKKRGQPPLQRADRDTGQTREDSCLRTVSSPSLNATLDAPEVRPKATVPERETSGSLNPITASKTIVTIQPLLDASDMVMSWPREDTERMESKNEAPSVDDIDLSPTLSQSPNASAKFSQTPEQNQKGRSSKWKRMRTLEWACERLAKRRKLSKGGFVARPGSEARDHHDMRMDSALSLLSLASSAPGGPPRDVVRGASLLLSFKHSWSRKQQA